MLPTDICTIGTLLMGCSPLDLAEAALLVATTWGVVRVILYYGGKK